MAPFEFKSNKHFVASSDGVNLQVYELTKPTLTHPSSIRKTHWREVANINTIIDDEDDEDDDMVEPTEMYDGLLFFDGHGKIEGRVALTKLAQHLKLLSLMVSPGGLCFQDVNELGEYADFGIHYLRLNDLFSWPYHGVSLATTIAWGRSELKYHEPRHGQRLKQTEGGNTVTMEMYERLKRLVKEKDEKLVQLKEEADDDMQNLREEKEDELREEMAKLNEAKDEELRKLRKEKDEELRELSRKKNAELRILRKGKDGGAALQKLRAEKDEELRKLRDEWEEEMEKLRKENDDKLEKLENEKEEEMSKRLEEKDDELEKLRKEKDGELQRVTKEKDEELQTLRKKKNNRADSEIEGKLQKLRLEKDEEIRNLRREKDEEIEKTVNNNKAETLRKLNEKDEELRKLRQEKEDEAAKSRRTEEKLRELREKKSEKTTSYKYSDEEAEAMKKEKDEELQKLRDQLSSTTTELTSAKQILEQYLKTTSLLLPGDKILHDCELNSREKEVWVSNFSRISRPIPPETFYWLQAGDDYFLPHRLRNAHAPMFTAEREFVGCCQTYYPVEAAAELLAPQKVYMGTRGEGEFDVNNWRFMKATHPEGGTTMLAYYDGDRNRFDDHRLGTIPIPYSKGAVFYPSNNFYLAFIQGRSMFCFTYRN